VTAVATGQLASPRRGALDRVPSPALIVTGIASVQIGAAFATTMFDRVGASGTVMLRLVFAALMLLVLWRPRVGSMTRRQWLLAAAFGVALAVMNFAFYQAIARIPLGIAVAVEFLGPLAVAVLGSRRAVDVAWVALAALGVLALTHGSAHGLDTFGIVCALIAGAAWAAYILVNARVGQAFSDGTGLAVAMCIGTALTIGPGIAEGGTQLLSGHMLLVGAAVGLLSSAVPYSLELEALRRITPRVFGVLMSLEPAVAALAGFVIIGQGLTLREVAGVTLVVAASAGAARASAKPVAAADLG
jgi:inner membrane transporter RhtA